MCLILIAWRVDPGYPCVVAANRDEFFSRPSATLAFWDDQPQVLAGRDLRAGGTWMGVHRNGRFAALTNYREPENHEPNAPSRGAIVSNFLKGQMEARDYWNDLLDDKKAYNGFNLVCGQLDQELWYFSNRDDGEGRNLSPGIYGLSNHLLDTPWPKVARGKSDFAESLRSLPDDAPLFRLLRDGNIHDDSSLPRTGVNLEWERLLSAAFVRSPNYGTCSSTIVKLDSSSLVTVDEQSFTAGTQMAQRNRFRFSLRQ